MSDRARILCPTCKQDMKCEPRDGDSGEDCPQCGQGLTEFRAKKLKKLMAAQEEQRE